MKNLKTIVSEYNMKNENKNLHTLRATGEGITDSIDGTVVKVKYDHTLVYDPEVVSIFEARNRFEQYLNTYNDATFSPIKNGETVPYTLYDDEISRAYSMGKVCSVIEHEELPEYRFDYFSSWAI